MRCSLSAVAFGFFLLAGSNAADVQPDPRVSARAKYAKHSAEALKIVEPVKISRVFYWKDGGTVGLELADAKGKKHAFCLYSPGGAGLPEKDKKPRIILNLFIGAAYPTHDGAKMVDVRGPEESALYGVLLRAIDSHKERDAILAQDIDRKLWEARKLWGTDIYETRTFFHRLESHFLKETAT
ncbi:MAG TPA: hypothetical protein VNX28_11250 [Gemmataceae bacterium]|jgi:hypothetical protein|nr:hypothetical protein [Gemmataceae bacterium]